LLPAVLTASHCPHLIGGGGKTTLLYALARAAVARGETAITTTTTRILAPAAHESPALLIRPDAASLAAALSRYHHVTAAAADNAGKLRGDAAFVEQLAAGRAADRLIVEADGSAGLPLKAHADHEPVISRAADAVIALIGADCIMMPLGDRTVHRSALFAERFALAPGTLLSPAHVAAAVLPPRGYAARVPASLPFIAVITKAVTPLLYRQARELALLLRAHPRVSAVCLGDLLAGELAAVD